MHALLLRPLAIVLLWLGAAGGAWAQDVLPVPPLSARVIDQTATLQPAQREALERKLADFEAQAGPQVVVVLVSTTQPEDIASFTQRLGDAWKIGRRDVGDGLLFVVAKNDRRVWIAPAKALEGAVPDLAARQIIERAVTPAFRNGDFAGGINAGIDQLMARIRGEQLPAPSSSRRGTPADEGVQWDELLMFFFIGVPVIGTMLKGVLGRKLGTLAAAGGTAGIAWWLTASALLAAGAGVVALLLVGLMGLGGGRRGLGGGVPIIWGGGGGGFGGGGGGFSSGGGGDFGGGGAGGSW